MDTIGRQATEALGIGYTDPEGTDPFPGFSPMADTHRWVRLADQIDGDRYPTLRAKVETLVQTTTGQVLVIDTKTTNPDYSGIGGYGITYSGSLA